MVTKEELRETMELAGNYSLYAYEEELRRDFSPWRAVTGSAWPEK